MSLGIGIIGLPNVGKSTLFNALADTSVPCSNYPFCTIDANVGVVPVPDDRLDRLGELLAPEKLTPTSVRFVDIAGLTKGASRGEGLGNKFLASIRDVDAVAQVVRCFSTASVSHVEGSVDPERDIDLLWTELLLADLEAATRNRERHTKAAGRGDKEAGKIAEVLSSVQEGLEQGVGVRAQSLDGSARSIVDEYRFLTGKEVLYIANIDEGDVGAGEETWVSKLARAAEEPEWKIVPICATLELELLDLNNEDRAELLAGTPERERGLDRLVRAGHAILNLVTFFTIKGTEVRAWTVEEGTPVSQAAGKIHSDMEDGFIRAEVVPFATLLESGSMHAARESGQSRTEGRDYRVQDGDVILVHFR